jgi:hypothetical protein
MFLLEREKEMGSLIVAAVLAASVAAAWLHKKEYERVAAESPELAAALFAFEPF